MVRNVHTIFKTGDVFDLTRLKGVIKIGQKILKYGTIPIDA